MGDSTSYGDSTLNGIQENLMGPRFKVPIVRDFYNYAIPVFANRPSYVIVMAGTNDSINMSSEEILVELVQLKKFIESNPPDCKVIISCSTDRFD